MSILALCSSKTCHKFCAMNHVEPNIIFDRSQVQKQFLRARHTLGSADFLFREAAERVSDTLLDFTREFPLCADLSAYHGALRVPLQQSNKVQNMVYCYSVMPAHSAATPIDNETLACVVDDEVLPFAKASLDGVFSVLSMQWVNDLPGLLAQIFAALKPDGVLLAIVPGGETLHELRSSLAHAETMLNGGVSPRVSPFIDVREAGALLQRAGFSLPVVESDMLTVTYDSMFALMHDLRSAGQTNALAARPRMMSVRRLFVEAAQYYVQHFSDDEGRIRASVELVTLTAFKPADNQQKPAKRGSGTISFEQALT